MKYENEELIIKADNLAKIILESKGHTYCRDKFFPLMCEKMGYKTGAEIGVDTAKFSAHMLAKTTMGKYYCVDPWPDDFGSNHKPGYFDKAGDNRYQEALKNLAPFGNRAVICKGMSVDVSKQIEDESIDFCYIDGDHSLFGIMDDIRAWTPKIRHGGIISGHDYKDGPGSGMKDFFGKQLSYRIKTVVDDYCLKYGHSIRVVGGRIKSWWFIKNRHHE